MLLGTNRCKAAVPVLRVLDRAPGKWGYISRKSQGLAWFLQIRVCVTNRLRWVHYEAESVDYAVQSEYCLLSSLTIYHLLRTSVAWLCVDRDRGKLNIPFELLTLLTNMLFCV